ncbi:hypothetical protein QA601_00710 [Chitinispirillales bacterium ANBcel5]|uniref:hypothetical protein n=1 Tax=Cellulosispirillum alkaliphilum TaxID=3039283 RepID=UPI002A53DC9D|nr:hypothetical protein [Chitinispirillales bacterium ANBcel5]
MNNDRVLKAILRHPDLLMAIDNRMDLFDPKNWEGFLPEEKTLIKQIVLYYSERAFGSPKAFTSRSRMSAFKAFETLCRKHGIITREITKSRRRFILSAALFVTDSFEVTP